MEITKDNFQQAYALLKSSIKDADFIAIDGEFTGLSTLRNRRVTYETLEEKFDWLCRGTSQMLLVQYGICLFTWHDDKKRYEALPMSFYLFPRPYKRNFNDVMFMSQSSSLDFLANNDFDFNKWIHKGVSYLSTWQEAKVRERLDRELSFCAANPVEISDKTTSAKVFIPKTQKVFIDGIIDDINVFIKDNDKSTLDLPSCNAFQRKLIYETVEEKFPVGVFLESVSDESKRVKFIRVIKVSEFGLEEMKNDNRRKELEYFDEILGFSKVMKLLTESKKPIVGHNMIFDLFLTVFNFFDNRITSLYDFKLLLNQHFPVIYDTKLMTSTQPLAEKVHGTSVSKLYSSLGKQEDDGLPDPCVFRSEKVIKNSESSNVFHQAGHDAFCTGSIFISACKALQSSANLSYDRVDLNADIINPFVNKINIQSILDISYMDLSGPDKIPSRKNVFLLQFPKQWTDKDIEDLFSPVCVLKRPIVWVSDRSVYVTLQDESLYPDVMNAFVLNRKSTDPFVVMPYAATVKSQSSQEVNPSGNDEERSHVEKTSTSRKRKPVESDIEDGEICSEDDDEVKKRKSNELFHTPTEW